MARKHSGEIVTRTIRQRQKNGDIYVIERKTQYDPEKKPPRRSCLWPDTCWQRTDSLYRG